MVSATDNLDGDIVPVYIENIQNITCPYTIVRSWIATDSCGNIADFTQTIILSDIAPPVVVGLLDVTVNCDDGPFNNTSPFMDICDDNPFNSYVDTMEQMGCELLVKRTWTSTDRCGNTASADQFIHIVDNVAPNLVFTNPLLQGLTDGGTLVVDCNDQPSFGVQDAEAFDDCSSLPTISFADNGATFGDCPTDGFTVILSCTWTASDGCGNQTSITINIRMEDHTPPVFINVPPDLTIPCGGSAPFCGNPQYGDFCGNATLASTSIDMPNADGFERVCTWIATDGCGNTSTATQTIYVIEGDLPELIGVPGDITVYLPNGDTLPLVADVTAMNGCGSGSVSVIFCEIIETSGNGCETTITRTWTATDNQGQTVEDQQIIRVANDLQYNINSNMPDTCAMSLGSAELSPDTYNYTWSDGGTGATRSGLLTGTYTITVEENGCTEELSLTIGNILQMMPPNVATAPESCGNGNGAITLSPDTYSYSWSDGEMGAIRSNLPAGIYTVTVSNGTCNAILNIEIENLCPCAPAVLDSLELVVADCGMANGSATLHLEGDEQDYTYTWVPDVGVSLPPGNARIGLAPERYTIFAAFQGDPDCVEMFEFDLMDNCFRCPPSNEAQAMTIYTNGSSTTACLPMPYGTTATRDLTVNGSLSNATLTACNEQDVFGYDYEKIYENGQQGRVLAKWDHDPAIFQTLVNNMDELAASMHQVDPDGQWRDDPQSQRIINIGSMAQYGPLKLFLYETGEEFRLPIRAAKTYLGTQLSVEKGSNQLVSLNSTSGCADTMNVDIKPIDPTQVDFHLYPNPANKYTLLDLQPAFGGPTSIQIFDYLGNTKTIVFLDEVVTPIYELDLTDYKEGLYFIHIQIPNIRSAVLKMVVGKK